MSAELWEWTNQEGRASADVDCRCEWIDITTKEDFPLRRWTRNIDPTCPVHGFVTESQDNGQS